MTLEQAAARHFGTFAPAHEGRAVILRGQVNTTPINFYASKYSQIAIQDRGRGFILEGPPGIFSHLAPGQWIEVEGTIGAHAGLPVLTPRRITDLEKGSPPQSVTVDASDLMGFRYMGMLVTADLTVAQLGENTGGIYLNIGNPDNPLKIFAPLPGRNVSWNFGPIKPGDKVRATGIASQYCPTTPYNRRFQLLVRHPAQVVRLKRGWFLPPWALILLVIAAIGSAVLLWRRELRHRGQRDILRKVYELSEEIFATSSLTQVAAFVMKHVSAVFRVSSARLYVYNRVAKTLDPIPVGEQPPMPPIPLESSRRGLAAGLASCFKNRTLLFIPDLSRSPFSPEPGGSGPHSVLLLNMFAQGESMGILQLSSEAQARNFSSLEKLVAQHLANQIAVAIRLLEQRSIREQLFRTEKIAAVGRLITGVVNELQAPLAHIASMSEHAAAENPAAGTALRVIHAEAQRAGSIVTRLVSFNHPQQVDAEPVDVNRVLRGLMEFRELEWKSRGIHLRNFLREGPLIVTGAATQLEQVFLSMIIHAEQELSEAPEKVLSIGSNLIANRVLIEISFSSPPAPGDPFANSQGTSPGTLDLGVCRSIIEGHEGQVRLTVARAAESRFEVELPWSSTVATAQPLQPRPARERGRQLTAVLMEPDENVERQLTGLLSARGCRVVPVGSAEEGLDLAQRLRFEIMVCSARVPGLNWIELMNHARTKVDAFVLLTDGWDLQRVPAAEQEGGYFVLPKPIDASRLDEILYHLLDAEGVNARAVTISGRTV